MIHYSCILDNITAITTSNTNPNNTSDPARFMKNEWLVREFLKKTIIYIVIHIFARWTTDKLNFNYVGSQCKNELFVAIQ